MRDEAYRTAPAVTVTTVLYNSAGSLQRYADALRPATEQGFARVVAVDNASPDDSAAVLKRLLPSAELISSPINVGFGRGCNLAWPRVTTRYWLLLNPDVEADAEGIGTLVRWMDARPDVGAASPSLVRPDGTPLQVARAPDALWRPVVEMLRLHKALPRSLRTRLLLAGHHTDRKRVDGWVPAAALIVRRSAVEAAGLFSQRLFMYGEDREWCWRARKSGWAIGVCHEVEFVHEGAASSRATWRADDVVRREVDGHLRAAALMRGQGWARVLALLTGLALTAESRHPRRDQATRSRCRLLGHYYLRWRPRHELAPPHGGEPREPSHAERGLGSRRGQR